MTIDTSTLLLLGGQAVAAAGVVWRLGGRQARYEQKVDDLVEDVKGIKRTISEKLVTQSECDARMAGGD